MNSQITLVGLGSAGCNLLRHLANSSLDGVRCLAIHSHQRELEEVGAGAEMILLGADLTRGIGTGGDPDLGHAIAEREAERLKACFQGSGLVLIVAGLGGGTAGGVAPVLARVAKEAGALVLGIATLPFDFEGARRQTQGAEALLRLRAAADAVVCLPNEKLRALLDGHLLLQNTFKTSNELLAQAVQAFWQMLAQPGLLNVTLADLCSALRGRHVQSAFATAHAEGENRPQQLIEQLSVHPLLDSGQAFNSAETILVSIRGGEDLALDDVQRLMDYFNREAESPRVVVGVAVDEACAGSLSLSVVVCRRNDPVQARQFLSPTFGESGSEDGHTVAGQDFFRGVTLPKTSARYVPPPPELNADQQQVLFESRSGSRGRSTKRWKQEQLPLQIISKGRFQRTEPTLHRGEDLDVPTYIRRGLAFN